jgi:iron complex transport system substrate-binding protein
MKLIQSIVTVRLLMLSLVLFAAPTRHAQATHTQETFANHPNQGGSSSATDDSTRRTARLRAAPNDELGSLQRFQTVRIITLSPHLAEWVDAAGASTALVGVSKFTNYPSYTLSLPQVSDAGQLFIESIFALKPTHVLAWKEGTPKQHLNKLKQLGLNVIVLSSAHLSDISTGIKAIANITHSTPAQAVALPPKQTHQQTLNKPKALFFEVWSKPLMTLGATQFLIEALGLCGLTTAFPTLTAPAVSVSPEAVVLAKPDIWLSFSDKAQSELLKRVPTPAHWQAFSHLPFVQQQRSFLLNSDIFSRPTPRLIAAIPELCQQLSTSY